MYMVLDVERGNLADDNSIGEEKNYGGDDGGEEPPHLFTSPLPFLDWQLSPVLVAQLICATGPMQ